MWLVIAREKVEGLNRLIKRLRRTQHLDIFFPYFFLLIRQQLASKSEIPSKTDMNVYGKYYQTESRFKLLLAFRAWPTLSDMNKNQIVIRSEMHCYTVACF